MTAKRRFELRRLEGAAIHLALTDGTRLDDVSLVSARGATLWIFDTGGDRFVPIADVIDFWASEAGRSAA